jgi:hypothetical protein
MPRTTTTTSVTTGGGGIGGGLVVILGLLVLAPVVGIYVSAAISLLATIVLCIVVLALTGGALYWLREYTREKRIRLEQEVLLARHDRLRALPLNPDLPVLDSVGDEATMQRIRAKALGITVNPKELEQ